MNYQDYYIPVNFTDAGKLAGMFPIHNAIEAIILAAPVVFCCSGGMSIQLLPLMI